MLKKTFLFIFFLLPFTLFAQSSFIIKGSGGAYKDGDSLFLSYRMGSKLFLDSTVVRDHAFSFQGNIKVPCRAYICRNDNPARAVILKDAIDIYLEPGEIFLKSNDTLSNSLLSGTPLNNDQAQLFAALKPIREENKTIKDIDNFTPEELKDTTLVRLTKENSLTLYYKRISIELEFANNHTDSYVSLVNLARIAKTSKYLTDVEKIFAKLPQKFKVLPEGKDISRRLTEGLKTHIGMMAKDFTQPDVNGRLIKRSDFKGKYVLIDFWASWCTPCREEKPNLIYAYQKYKNKNFSILSISIDRLKDKKKWLQAIKDDKLPWKQVSDLNTENAAAKLYGVTAVPANVLVGPDGQILAKDLKGKELLDKLATLF
jgi:thiol-disulfide isomerase/thioredoxin